MFEDCHTHPIIKLDDQGEVEMVAHSEVKRGICALPYEQYEPAMDAYCKVGLVAPVLSVLTFASHFLPSPHPTTTTPPPPPPLPTVDAAD